jgi:cytoskeletal protein CcmA (bactofilin family)
MSNGAGSHERAQPGVLPEARAVIDERRVNAWIGKSLTIQGKVISSQDLTIEGQVEGTIELGDHTLTIGMGAGIKADLVAKAITISGAVTGNVTASDKVDLRATGSVDGDVIAPRVIMAEGGVINGRVDVAGTKGNAGKGQTS